ncbi:MAG: tRNA (guanosine(37)-N1)-methyltransferase TrmD [Deltaproteobacteria bacterium]|nr:tRNA (guanosine(37)-N1)-methyltransferase TrmD [Candidatus Anaeroferrophillus wilburensis]MBN2889078.1 tRNA (guanosine(37)-N1)-methyltransferase TrmD [Deltaproteobacteria bacterium]
MLQIDVVTIFPRMFDSPFAESMIRRAIDRGLLDLKVHNLRDYCHDRHRVVDDYPYGGGAGMVMRPEPAIRAITAIKGKGGPGKVILTSPQGTQLTQKLAGELAGERQLIFFCGHYEGVDERIRAFVDQEISIGDYVLTGGELPAMVIIDTVVRLLPGVLGSADSLAEESFSPLLEYPHYTRPADYDGLVVPEVLRSGHHEQISQWRRTQALWRTFCRRPDLLSTARLSAEEMELVARWERERENGKQS